MDHPEENDNSDRPKNNHPTQENFIEDLKKNIILYIYF
jgi:hypothetical protein